MRYELNIEEIKNNYKFGKDVGNIKLQHNTGRKVSVLPYNTKYENKHIEYVENFKSAVGEFSRLLSSKEYSDQSLSQEWIGTIIDKIDIEDKDKFPFRSILNELFFNNESEEIDTFHPVILNYVKKDKSGDYNKNLAEFLYDVLLRNDDVDILKQLESLYSYRTNNILTNLVLDSLPKLEPRKKQHKKKYKEMLPLVSEVFNEDFKYILKKPKLFIENFSDLLKFYYFIYMSQLVLNLKQLTLAKNDSMEEIYFTLDWESTSRARTSYKEGWKLISSNLETLFSHANCLELLNHNNENKAYSYIEIKNKVMLMSDEEKREFNEEIKKLRNEYKKCITDIIWDGVNFSRLPEDETDREIYMLFHTIDYQFKNSTRKKPYLAYMRRFEDFCKFSFLKQRGSLGYTLNMTEENLIFLTKICIKDKERIKLKLLFEEYERRGVFFDKDSQNKIVILFEKLNLIEKKSDSGDAQYVKSIL